MNHARQLDVDGPFQRTVHFGGDVVALRRLAGIFELLHRLDFGLTPVTALTLAPVSVTLNFFPADQLAVGDALRGIGFHGDHGVADGELIDRHSQAGRCHFQQHTARFGGNAAHRPGISLHGGRPARSALIDGDVRAAHDAGGLIEGDVEFVGHQLAEAGSGALAAVRFADIKRGRVVLMDDDPRIELPEIGVGIGPPVRLGGLRVCRPCSGVDARSSRRAGPRS